MDGGLPEAGTRVPSSFTGRVVVVHRWGVYVQGCVEPAQGTPGGGLEVVVAVGGGRWPPGPWHLRLPAGSSGRTGHQASGVPVPAPLEAGLAPLVPPQGGRPVGGAAAWAGAVPHYGAGGPASPRGEEGWRLSVGDPARWTDAGGFLGEGPGAVEVPPPATWRRWRPPRPGRGPAASRRRAASVLGHLLAVAPRPGWRPWERDVGTVQRAAAAGDWAGAAEAAVRLLGAGPGLTPSGDDWLAGWAAYGAWRAAEALPPPVGAGRDPVAGGEPPAWLREAVPGPVRRAHSSVETGAGRSPRAARRSGEPAPTGWPLGFGTWRRTLRGEARRRTGPVSRALLDAALDGELPEPAASLLAALWAGDAAAVPVAARRVFRTGHSSGIDLAWGLWMAALLDAGDR
ncbi:hypothetical protein Tmar_1472 [Thermaerobacter marianensis DSM 12885]|uniref:DUF2877 domain-containing protein n=1 Tax=Thermaerobacter marianensis (strain ATCC 700841 / DSM 12885 / JCM 10246 / 7p75a) TaxID=644966 RepID=E6SGD3_THEM7|nr:DUF2877 domain-containing protein [Thermaerobacter marianensis]ADU51585.1 hypothetical protein Tmar_1472 [Thermaerobacter marianensis DSM 12885]